MTRRPTVASHHRNSDKHHHKSIKGICAATVIAASPLLTAATAGAATPTSLPSSLAAFANCPVSDPAVTLCIAGSTGGSFSIGSASLTLPTPATLSLGAVVTKAGVATAVLPTDGASALSAPTVTIPVLGGLLDVGATPSLAGLPGLSVASLLSASGTALTLPLVIQLSNPLLGSTCTVGTTSAPLTLDLTAGTTDPPAPNTPITGSRGTLTSTAKGLVTFSGATLVDNAFAAPGASGCGLFGTEDFLVDLLEGLPAAAGTNSAVLSGTVQTIPAKKIRKYLG